MRRTTQATWHDVPEELSLFRLWLPACLLVFLIVLGFSANEAYIPKGMDRGFGMFGLMGLGLYVLWQPGRAHLKRLKELAESCIGDERALVRILIVQQGAITGKDHGILYRRFGDLNFRGRRAEFSLSKSALLSVPFPTSIDSVRYTQLHLVSNDCEVCITDYLYDGKPAMGKTVDVIESWRETGDSPGPVEILPPTAFLPVVRVRFYEVIWRLVLLAGACWGVITFIQNPVIKEFPALTGGLISLWGVCAGSLHAANQLKRQRQFLRGKAGSRKLLHGPEGS